MISKVEVECLEDRICLTRVNGGRSENYSEDVLAKILMTKKLVSKRERILENRKKF